MEFYAPRHPEATQYGSGSQFGLYQLTEPFKSQQVINNKARRDPRLSLYRARQMSKYAELQHHFHDASTNPAVFDIYPNEVVWRHRDEQNTITFPDGDIRDMGYTALNGLSPLMNLKPIGVAAGSSAGDEMTDFAVTESGVMSLISTHCDIQSGDWVAAVFPSLTRFTSSDRPDERHSRSLKEPPRPPLVSRIPDGLPPEKIMAVIVPVKNLLNYANPDASLFASAMNGLFYVPSRSVSKANCVLPSYVRDQFQNNPTRLLEAFADPTDEFIEHCFPVDSDALRTDIWHNFGLGKALSTARKGAAFQCLLGAPFFLPRHEWETRPHEDWKTAANFV